MTGTQGAPALSELIASNVAAERARQRMDQADLALALGVDRSTVTRIENHQRLVQVDELEPLCRVLRCTLADLVRGATTEQMAMLGLQH